VGEELVELVDTVEMELGLVMTLEYGLFEVVGVALRLAHEETDELVGEGDLGLEYQGCSSCRLTMLTAW